jgi:hypothetical protein
VQDLKPLFQLYDMSPNDAAQIVTFTMINPDNSTTVYRVGLSAYESPCAPAGDGHCLLVR